MLSEDLSTSVSEYIVGELGRSRSWRSASRSAEDGGVEIEDVSLMLSGMMDGTDGRDDGTSIVLVVVLTPRLLKPSLMILAASDGKTLARFCASPGVRNLGAKGLGAGTLKLLSGLNGFSGVGGLVGSCRFRVNLRGLLPWGDMSWIAGGTLKMDEAFAFSSFFLRSTKRK